MKRLSLAVVFSLLLAPCARGAQADDRQPLRLTAEVVGRRYCAGAGANILQLSVRLRYRNEGPVKLYVYRGKNLFYQTRVRAEGEKPYEVVVTNSRYNDAEAEVIDAPRPPAAFRALRPGGTFETVITVGLGVVPEGAPRAANAVRPGRHTLQVVTSSWYESRRLGEELRERWRGSGLLWIEPIAAPPVAFEAGGEAPAARCL